MARGTTPNRAGITVACRTYRKAVNKTAQALGIPPIHTGYPSYDFDDMLVAMDAKSRERALKLYRLGIRAGYDEATAAVANGKLWFDEGGDLVCPGKVTITRNVKFAGHKRKAVKFTYTAAELGFK
jgi:hypothetical protein